MNQTLKKFLGLQTGYSEHAPGTAKDCANFEISDIKGALQLSGGYTTAYTVPTPTDLGFVSQTFQKVWSFTTNEHGGKTISVLVSSITRQNLSDGVAEKTKLTVWMRPYWSGAAWVDSWLEVGEFAFFNITSYSGNRITLDASLGNYSSVINSDRLKGWVAVLGDSWSTDTKNYQLITASSWNSGTPYIDVLGTSANFSTWTGGQTIVAYKNHLGSAMPADLELEIRNLYDQIRVTTGNDTDDLFFKGNFLRKTMSFGSITYDALQIERASFDFKTLAAQFNSLSLSGSSDPLEAGTYDVRFSLRMDDGQETHLLGSSSGLGHMFYQATFPADAPTPYPYDNVVVREGYAYVANSAKGTSDPNHRIYKFKYPSMVLENTLTVNIGTDAQVLKLFYYGGSLYAFCDKSNYTSTASAWVYKIDPVTMTVITQYAFTTGYMGASSMTAPTNLLPTTFPLITNGAGKFAVLLYKVSEWSGDYNCYVGVLDVVTGVTSIIATAIPMHVGLNFGNIGLTTLSSYNSTYGIFPIKPPGSATLFYSLNWSAMTISPHTPYGTNAIIYTGMILTDGTFLLAGDQTLVKGTAPSWALGSEASIDDGRSIAWTGTYIVLSDVVPSVKVFKLSDLSLQFTYTPAGGTVGFPLFLNLSDPEKVPFQVPGSPVRWGIVVAETSGGLVLGESEAEITYKVQVSPSLLPRGARWVRVYAQKDGEGYYLIREHDLTTESFAASSVYDATLQHQFYVFTNAFTITAEDFTVASTLANAVLGRDPTDDGVIKYTRSVTANNRTYAVGVVLDGTAQLNKVFASAVGSVIMHDVFPNDVSTVLDVDYNDGDVPIALAVMSDRIVVLKRRSIVLLTLLGDGSYSRDLVAVGIGCASAESVVSYNEQVMFLGHTGIYKFSTSGLEFIGSQIQPDIDALTESDRESAKAVIDGKRKEYRLYISTKVYVYNMLDGTWMRETYWDTDTVHSLTKDTNNDQAVRPQDRYLVLLSRYVAVPPSTTFYIMRPSDSELHYGAPYTAFYDTNKIELEGIGDGYDGLLLGVAIHYRASSSVTASVELYRGDDLTPVSSVTLDNDKPSAMIAAPLGTRAKSFRVKIIATPGATSQAFKVDRLAIYYQVIPAGGDGEGVLDYES